MKVIKDKYFNVVTNTDNGIPELLLYGYIGQDFWWDDDLKEQSITDLEFIKALRKLEEAHSRINIRINSPGGSMFHGNAIISAIKNSKAEIHTYNDGIAASMAASIWLAAANRHMADSSLLMVHSPITFAFGNAKDLRAEADLLDKFAATLINVAAEALGWDKKKVTDTFFNYEDHWLTAEEVKDLGLIKEVEDYKTQPAIENIQNMKFQDIINHFTDQKDDEANGWLTKIMSRFKKAPNTQNTISKSIKSNADMNIEEFKNSLGDNTLKMEDVQAALLEKGFNVTPVEAAAAAAATVPAAPEKTTAELIAEAVKPLNDTIITLQAEVKKLGDAPGGVVTRAAAAAGDNTDLGDDEPNEFKDLEAFNNEVEDAASKNTAIPIG